MTFLIHVSQMKLVNRILDPINLLKIIHYPDYL